MLWRKSEAHKQKNIKTKLVDIGTTSPQLLKKCVNKVSDKYIRTISNIKMLK